MEFNDILIPGFVIEEYKDDEMKLHVCEDIEIANKQFNILMENRHKHETKYRYVLILRNQETWAKLRQYDSITDSC